MDRHLSLRREVLSVEDVYICELCQKTYEPEEIDGVKKLKEFNGYTVDLRLQEFRKMKPRELPEFLAFASPQGKMLLAQMHEEATR